MAMDPNHAVGLVESIDGLVTALHSDDTEAELTLGSTVYLNDPITTDESAAVSIRFTDKTSFSIREDSRLTIDEYIYDLGIAEGKVDISVLKGMFVFVSGLVADENPQNMTISTPGTTIGIRGTEGGGEIGDAGEFSYYFNADGIIEIITPAGSVTIDDAREVAVVSPSGTPALATGWSAEQIIETFVSALRVAPLEVSQRIIDADDTLNVDACEYIEHLVQQESGSDSGDAQEASGEEESESNAYEEGVEGEESQSTLTDDTIVEAERSAVVLDISFGRDESQRQEYDASELLQNSPGSLEGVGNSEEKSEKKAGQDTAETVTSAATSEVGNTNDAPDGLPAINGTATQGETLTAVASGISDADGLGSFSYQWLANGTVISGATSETFLLTQT